MASTYLTRTMSQNSNQKVFTLSTWVKRCGLGRQVIMGVGGSGNYAMELYFTSGGQIDWWNYFNGSYAGRKTTNRLFRDTNGWYHIVARWDTTDSTASNRMRLYVNGVEETSFSNDSDPSLNTTSEWNSASAHEIGRNGDSSYCFDGQMSHFHFVDGSQLAPTVFGETDTTTGEWKIKTAPSFTPGSNGFTIMKDGNTITDQSSNSNDFTLSQGTLTKTEDCPSNVFAVCDNLTNTNSALTFSHGNTTMTNSGQWLGALSTLPMFKGKFYWEFKCTGNFMTGVSQLNSKAVQTDNLSVANNGYSSKWAYGWEMINGGNKANNNSSSTSYGSSYSSGDIGMVAFDADVGAIWFGKNGTWQASATQTEIENGTTTNAAWTGLTNASGYVASFSTENSTMNLNFGNGYFGTTAVSSAGNNASGFGIFEYDVPAGFTALCTKGINSF